MDDIPLPLLSGSTLPLGTRRRALAPAPFVAPSAARPVGQAKGHISLRLDLQSQRGRQLPSCPEAAGPALRQPHGNGTSTPDKRAST